MSNTESLGTEFSTEKIYFAIAMFVIYLVYFFLILATLQDPVNYGQADKIWYYIWFGLILGFLPFIIDLLISQNQDLPLDTISYENNSPFAVLNDWRVQLGTSIVFGFAVLFGASVRGEAFVKAPLFSITVPMLSTLGFSQKIINGFISGITAGVIESVVFFGFLLPTLYALFKRFNEDDISAGVFAVFMAALIFTGYHFFVYGYEYTSLIWVFGFGVLQGAFVVVYRSMVPLFVTHFMNNFAVYLFGIAGYMVQVIL